MKFCDGFRQEIRIGDAKGIKLLCLKNDPFFRLFTSFSRVGYTEYLQLFVGKSDTSEHQSVATEGFD